MFITHQSIGLPDASREPAGIPSCLPACSSGLVWEIDCSRIRDRSVACQAACSQVQSKPSRTQRRRQLGCLIPESHNDDVAELNDPKKVAQSIDRDLKQSDTEDPNTVGLVPAFILGDIYVCKVPERDSRNKSMDADNIDEEDAAPRTARVERPPSARLALLMSIGKVGPASGLVGVFASKAAARLVACEMYQQRKLTNAEDPVEQLKQGVNEARIKRHISSIARRASHWKNFWRRDLNPDVGLRSDIVSCIKGMRTALLQADDIGNQIDEATEELIAQEDSVKQLSLSIGLDMAMTWPRNVRFMNFLWSGKGTGMPRRKKRHGQSRQDDGSGPDGLVSGMATYTIPGISFTMPSSVGPLQFSPLFTTRHTAEIAWEVVREAMMNRGFQKRKLKRFAERHATEMGAARLTGLASRVETQGSHEDEEGLSEPAEMAEFLNELGEGDSRSSNSTPKFRPRGPFDYLGALACGSVSLFAWGVEWSGNTADDLFVHSPLGRWAFEMVKRPGIQEQPLHTAIAHARDSNRALQQVSALTQALAQQQDAHALLTQFLGGSNAAGLPSSSTADAAKQGNTAEEGPGSASISQQHASAGAHRAQHAEQGHKFESAEAKPAQEGGLAGQLPEKGGEGRFGKTDKAPPGQHDGDHSQHRGDHAQLNGDHAQASQQAAAAQASTSTSASTDSSGSSQQHSTTPQHGTPPRPGSSRGPQPGPHQQEPASSDSKLPSLSSAPASATPSAKQDPFSNADPQNSTVTPSLTGPQPQPAVASQQQSQSEAQAQDPVRDALALQGIQPMPAKLPGMHDLRCVLGNGEQVTMLEGLQGLITGLHFKLFTDQQDKLQFPMEVPIMLHDRHVLDEISGASTAKALIHFDMAVANGRTAAVEKDSNAEWPAAKAVMLMGDVGFEKYRNASEVTKSMKTPGHARQFGEATVTVAFRNLSPLVGVMEEQQQGDMQDP